MRAPRSRRLPRAGALLLLAAWAAVLAAAPAEHTLTARNVSGATSTGRFVALTPSVLRVLPAGVAPGATQDVALDTLRDVDFADAPTASAAVSRLRVTLVGGEVLLAEAWEPAPDGLTLSAPALGRLRLSFEVVRSLVPLAAKASECHDPTPSRARKPGQDHLQLVSGDELGGTLIEARPEGLLLEIERGRQRTVGWGELLVAHLDNPEAPPPSGAVVEVETYAGDLLRSNAGVTGDVATGLSLALASDAAVLAQVPLGLVRSVRWRGGRCVDASSLAFTSTYVPLLEPPPGSLTAQFLERERGVRVGRRPRGCPLRLGGRTYAHGFAVHSGSTIRLPLGGAYLRFDGLVGIDDEAKEVGRGRVEVPGDVDVRVSGDGRVLWEAQGVTGLEGPRRVGPVDVKGVNELVLSVDYGGHDETLDRVTWADPVLLR